MNVIKVYGGLGNQLFQYAFGKAQVVNGIEVRYDLSWFKRPQDFSRPYRLDKFSLEVKENPFLGQRTITEDGYSSNLVKMDNCNFSGYWQYHAYYEDILPVLKKEFRVKEEFYTEEFLDLRGDIVDSNSVAVHVRRGDLLVNDRDYAQTLDYYNKAINCMKRLKNNCKFFIFSDDISWCKENFKGFTFISLIDYLDFELLKLCKHNIITNSTFSWWASFLNENISKTIMAPKMWRSDPIDQVEFEKKLYLFNEWIIL